MNIRELVEQAGLDWHRGWPVGDDEPNRFEVLVKLAIAHEREECIQNVLQQHEGFGTEHQGVGYVKQRIVEAIRARSNA
jgi:hypothetical protein